MTAALWNILEKKVVPHERKDGNYLTLVVERDGVRANAVVSGFTFHSSEVGRPIDLPGLEDYLRRFGDPLNGPSVEKK